MCPSQATFRLQGRKREESAEEGVHTHARQAGSENVVPARAARHASLPPPSERCINAAVQRTNADGYTRRLPRAAARRFQLRVIRSRTRCAATSLMRRRSIQVYAELLAVCLRRRPPRVSSMPRSAAPTARVRARRACARHAARALAQRALPYQLRHSALRQPVSV